MKKLVAILFMSVALTVCAAQNPNPRDPFEKTNRAIFQFNDRVDRVVIKPIAQAYQHIVPSPIRTAALNFFDNLYLLPTVANDALQCNINQTMKDSWRFIINSTFGIGGMLDVAKNMGLPRHFNDFGITLARLGDKHSPYLVIPLVGSSTLRDGFGLLVDNTAFLPFTYIDNNAIVYSLLGARVVVYRADLLDSEHMINGVAIDRYAFMRDAYLQYRDHLIAVEQNGATPSNNSQALYVAENE